MNNNLFIELQNIKNTSATQRSSSEKKRICDKKAEMLCTQIK